MPDNLLLKNDDTTEIGTVATDLVGGIHYPRSKVGFGADGEYVDVSADDPLPVELSGGTVAATQSGVWNVGVSGSVVVSDGGSSITVDGTIAATQSGAWSVSIGAALPAGSNTIGGVTLAEYTAVSGRLPVDGSGVTQPVSDGGGSLTIDDGGATLSIDDGGNSITVDGTVAATQSGTWTEANSAAIKTAVETLDNLVLAEDAVHANGAPGVLLLTVRADTAASTAGTDGDYAGLVTDGSGRLYVNGSGVTQPISAASLPLPDGAATADRQDTGNTSLATLAGAVSGTELQVDVVSSALPSGAATAAKQPALGTAGTASADVITVQGIASMTALKVDGSAVAQPVTDDGGSLTVDGTVAATQSGTWNIGTVTTITNTVHVDDAGGSLTVDGSVSVAPAGAFPVQIDSALPAGTNSIGTVILGAGTAAIGKLTANSGVDIGDVDVTSIVPGTGATNLGKAIDTATGATDTGVLLLATRDNALSTLTPAEGDNVQLRTDANGALWVIPSGTVTVAGSVTVSGSVTANAGTDLNTSALALEAGGNLAAAATSLAIADDWDESDRCKVNPIAGQAGVAGGAGAVGATTQRVTLASDDPAVAALQILDNIVSGNEAQVDVVAALPAGDNNIGNVDIVTVPAPLSTTGGGTEAAALRVTIATDSTGVVSVDDNGGSLSVDDGGSSLTVDGTVAVSTVTTVTTVSTVSSITSGNITPVASASGTGTTAYRDGSVTNSAETVKGSAGRVYGFHVYNPNTADGFIHFYDTTGAVTVGTTTPTRSYRVPGKGYLTEGLAIPHSYANGIKIAVSTTFGGGSAPTTAFEVQIEYA